MRRFLLFVLCCLLLITPVLAESSVSDILTNVTVTTDGTCQVYITATLRLDESAGSWALSLPDGAQEVYLNGSAVTPKNNQLELIGVSSGVYTLDLRFFLPNAVHRQEDVLLLEVPLLSGFPYPVEAMTFTVTLPGAISAQPTFISGYYQDNIDSMLTYQVSGATVSGTITSTLKDHETLAMSMAVTEDLFPQPHQVPSTLTFDWIGLGICMALAILYWLVTMAASPMQRIRQTVPPAGISAGELGSCLTQAPVDLTMMVLTWAQQGYLIVQMENSGRIVLHKRLEMGNERSQFERYWFRALFHRRSRENAGGMRYTQLCHQVATSRCPILRELYDPKTGNPILLRLLVALGAVFSGLGIGDLLTTHPILRPVLMVALAVLAGIAAWHIQTGARSLFFGSRRSVLWTSLLCTAVWVLLGYLSGQPSLAGVAVALVWFSGLAAAYTGRRSNTGIQLAGEILGLRYHLRHCSPQELNRILRGNPNYFYDLAPYALALGVDRSFAKSMGKGHLPPCGWFITELDTPRSAAEWSKLLRQAADSMDRTYRHPILQRLFPGRFPF